MMSRQSLSIYIVYISYMLWIHNSFLGRPRPFVVEEIGVLVEIWMANQTFPRECKLVSISFIVS